MSEDLKDFYVDGCTYKTRLTRKFGMRKIKPQIEDPCTVKAFIPGLIKKIYVKEGDRISKGDKLVVLEAMKMENQILSATSGIIKKIHIPEGKVVVKNELLIEIET
jgi:biotin carboxyl carrier protein